MNELESSRLKRRQINSAHVSNVIHRPWNSESEHAVKNASFILLSMVRCVRVTASLDREFCSLSSDADTLTHLTFLINCLSSRLNDRHCEPFFLVDLSSFSSRSCYARIYWCTVESTYLGTKSTGGI